MIQSTQEVLTLLEQYLETQHELLYHVYMEGIEEWSTEKQLIYSYGVVLGKFQEKDEATLNTLKKGVCDNALYKEIHAYLNYQIKKLGELDSPDIMQKLMLSSCKKQIAAISTISFSRWINEYLPTIKPYLSSLSFDESKVLIFLYYAFENYNHIQKDKYNSDISHLSKIYQNVFDKQSQFYKYGIVPVDESRTLFPLDPPRLYDSSINKTFFTQNIPLHLLKRFMDLKNSGMIKDLSVRLTNEPGYDGKMCFEHLEEALERGKQFDFVNLGSYSVNKLFSTEYENSLWIIIDPENITFEEMCKDFECYNDMIVTQVIHLQYKKLKDDFYITHLDHEYIFYTVEEYDKRNKNESQKGNASKRIKSFKIDNSQIPFDYMCEIIRKDEHGKDLPTEKEQFLCYVLESYFKHKDLLNEYFQKIKQ